RTGGIIAISQQLSARLSVDWAAQLGKLNGPPYSFCHKERSNMPGYKPKVVEPRWQRFWEDHKTFRTPDVSDKPRFYILDMFPYPSGSGLHVGHPEGYTATDI